MPKLKIGYMCLTDWEHELDDVVTGTKVYPSIEDLKASRKCTDECGIVEITMTAKVIQESKLY